MEQIVVKRGLLRKTNALGNETIRLILNTARKLIAEQGIEKFTLSEIARNSNLTKGTLLYHFPSKHALLLALTDEYLSHLTSKLEEGKQNARESIKYNKNIDENVAGFVEWYRAYRKQDLSYSSFGIALLAYASKDQELRKKVLDWYKNLFKQLRKSPCGEAFEIVLALEGLFYLGHLGINPLNEKEYDKLICSMMKKINSSKNDMRMNLTPLDESFRGELARRPIRRLP